jgi:hypothetical protein
MILIYLIIARSGHGYAMVAPRARTVPPLLCRVECNFLEDNFLTCLKEKSVKDEVPVMKCNVEHVRLALRRSFGSILNAPTDSKTTRTPTVSAASSRRSRKAKISIVRPTSDYDRLSIQQFRHTNFEYQVRGLTLYQFHI